MVDKIGPVLAAWVLNNMIIWSLSVIAVKTTATPQIFIGTVIVTIVISVAAYMMVEHVTRYESQLNFIAGLV